MAINKTHPEGYQCEECSRQIPLNAEYLRCEVCAARIHRACRWHLQALVTEKKYSYTHTFYVCSACCHAYYEDHL